MQDPHPCIPAPTPVLPCAPFGGASCAHLSFREVTPLVFPIPFNTGTLPARRLPSCLDSPVEATVFIAWGRAVPACCAKPTRGCCCCRAGTEMPPTCWKKGGGGGRPSKPQADPKLPNPQQIAYCSSHLPLWDHWAPLAFPCSLKYPVNRSTPPCRASLSPRRGPGTAQTLLHHQDPSTPWWQPWLSSAGFCGQNEASAPGSHFPLTQECKPRGAGLTPWLGQQKGRAGACRDAVCFCTLRHTPSPRVPCTSLQSPRSSRTLSIRALCRDEESQSGPQSSSVPYQQLVRAPAAMGVYAERATAAKVHKSFLN